MRKSMVRIGGGGRGGRRAAEDRRGAEQELQGLDTRVAMIQALLPLGLKAANDVLKEEVPQLAGARYCREGGQPGYARWGGQQGSVYLADQKVGVRVPRVRDTVRDEEVPLATYAGLQDARRADDAALRKVLKGLSCRDYASCVDPIAETFGLSSSSLSRRFKRASAKKLQELSERDLGKYDIVGLFLDGKTFGDDEIVIALGVTLKGEKVVLGFVQTATENELVCTQFLRSLVERGLNVSQGCLCVIDGSKGLRTAIDKVFAGKALVQRCHWHKRETVVRYLPAGRQAEFRRKLQNGYQQPTYAKAKATLKKGRSELMTINTWGGGSPNGG